MGNVLFDLSEQLLQLRNDKEAIERNLRDCKKEIETVTKQMVDMMVQEEVQSFNKDGYTFYLKSSCLPVSRRKGGCIQLVQEPRRAGWHG